MKEKKKDIEVTYVSGWLRGRLAAVDETSGESQMVAGVMFRCRIDQVSAYYAGEPGIVLVWLNNAKEPIELIGSIEVMDKVMVRANLKEVGK